MTDKPAKAADPALWDLVREDYDAHGRKLWSPGFQSLAIYRFGVWRMNVTPRFLRAPLSLAYRALSRAASSVYGIELPYTARVGRRVVVEHQHGIVVHGQATIGDDCIIRHGVTLGIRSLDRKDEAPILGQGVNVGAGAKIIGRVHIGDGARIGANAVVLEDVPAGALAVGIPAQVVTKSSPAATPANGTSARAAGGSAPAELNAPISLVGKG